MFESQIFTVVPNKKRMYNIVIILLFVFKLTESKQLRYCPEVVNPNSPHGLTLPIKLNVNVRKWKPKGNK